MTWETRDLPVLKAIIELTEEGIHYIKPQQIAERTSMDGATIQRALAALAEENPPFFDHREANSFGDPSRNFVVVSKPTGHARRTVGAWPTPDFLADRIIDGLERAAEAEEDDDKRGRLKRTAAWFASAGRDILVDITGSAISTGMGM